ncbi:MAG: M42 family metallopeptidase [Blastochloris sp.]|nr:M42 family metallopeptidase [Blastochloris sp.]
MKVGDNLTQRRDHLDAIHLGRDQNVAKMSSLRIDIGAADKGEASGKVKPGDRIAFDARYLEIGERVLRGKAFDDRAGCSLLIDVLQDPDGYPVDVLAAFTVQEEIGLRGAMVAANTLKPDVSFALEGTSAGDQPDPTANPDDGEAINPTCVMGAGPVLTVIDSSTIISPRLHTFLRDTASREGIPYQIKTRPGGGTDSGAIQYANGGTLVANISLPCRYIHSPMAYLHRDDYDNALRLIKAALRSITPDVIAASGTMMSPNGSGR